MFSSARITRRRSRPLLASGRPVTPAMPMRRAAKRSSTNSKTAIFRSIRGSGSMTASTRLPPRARYRFRPPVKTKAPRSSPKVSSVRRLAPMSASQAEPGAAFTELVDVMDRLRRECPWTAQQTHASLARYLLEEAHETLEALDQGAGDDLCGELGDLLLQVVFRSGEHTSELQSRGHLVCRLLLEKKKGDNECNRVGLHGSSYASARSKQQWHRDW